jgi:hypothetical protein
MLKVGHRRSAANGVGGRAAFREEKAAEAPLGFDRARLNLEEAAETTKHTKRHERIRHWEKLLVHPASEVLRCLQQWLPPFLFVSLDGRGPPIRRPADAEEVRVNELPDWVR